MCVTVNQHREQQPQQQQQQQQHWHPRERMEMSIQERKADETESKRQDPPHIMRWTCHTDSQLLAQEDHRKLTLFSFGESVVIVPWPLSLRSIPDSVKHGVRAFARSAASERDQCHWSRLTCTSKRRRNRGAPLVEAHTFALDCNSQSQEYGRSEQSLLHSQPSSSNPFLSFPLSRLHRHMPAAAAAAAT